MRFEKWQALGNDYLIFEREHLALELTPARVRRICESHFGVGSDGILLLSRSQDPRFAGRVEIHNPDGSIAELSGNGVREAVLYMRRHGWADADTFAIETDAGEIRPRITGPNSAAVDMGHARLRSPDFPGGPSDGRGEVVMSEPERHIWSFRHVSIGNPQCAIVVPDLEALMALDLPRIGPAIEANALFPNRTNVSWYAELPASPDLPASEQLPGASASATRRIRARIFERGVGETLSSGTGASGAAIAYTLEREHQDGRDHAAGSARSQHVTVVLDGGELEVEVGGVEGDLHVELSGWAVPVFEGQLSEDLLRDLRQIV